MMINSEPKVQVEIDKALLNRGDGVYIPSQLPVCYESDYYSVAWEDAYYSGHEYERGISHEIDLNLDAYFIGFHGPKRNGKTLLMTFFAIKAMGLWNMPVWANYSIDFIWHDRHGRERECHSMPLDMTALITMKNDYNHGLMLLDELPLFLNSKSAMSTKNKILGLAMTQFGKKKLSVFASAQNEKWIDGVVGWQLDVSFFCLDMSKRYPERKMPRGTNIIFWGKDISGQWTGQSYDMDGEFHGPYELKQANKIWGCYKSYEEVDLLENLRPWNVDLAPTTITDKDKFKHNGALQDAIVSLKNNNVNRVNADDLWASLGPDVSEGDRRQLGSTLKKMGISKKQTTGGLYYYDLSGVKINQEN